MRGGPCFFYGSGFYGNKYIQEKERVSKAHEKPIAKTKNETLTKRIHPHLLTGY